MKEFIGRKYNRLVIIEEVESHITSGGHKKRVVKCLCDCGIKKDIVLTSVINGITKSCGCLSREKASRRLKVTNTSHGRYHTSEYNTWMSMRKRCNNIKHRSYADYGGRGIEVCGSWNDSFEAFYNDMGDKPSKKHSLDRIDNEKGYYKGNCRWATQKVQCQNQRSNVNITYEGETKCISEWARLYGMSYQKLYYRIFIAKYNLEKAFTE